MVSPSAYLNVPNGGGCFFLIFQTVLAALISHFAKFEEKFKVAVVGKLEEG